MTLTRKAAHPALTVGLFALLTLACPNARAQTVIVLDGHYDNNRSNTGSGYATSADQFGNPQSYLVTPTATFNNNPFDGLFASQATTVTVNGGTFNNNAFNGLLASDVSVLLNGGTFSGNGTDLFVQGSGTSLTLYGTGLAFDGLPAATTLTGSSVSGFITGRLRNNAAPSRLSFYINTGAHITLVNAAAVPEPSPAALAVPALGLLGLTLRARRRERQPA